MMPELSVEKLGSGSEDDFEWIAITSTNLFQKGLLIYTLKYLRRFVLFLRNPYLLKVLFLFSLEGSMDLKQYCRECTVP